MNSYKQEQDNCSFYINGNCKFGDRCFKHHSYSLRIKFLETENRKIKRKNKQNINLEKDNHLLKRRKEEITNDLNKLKRLNDKLISEKQLFESENIKLQDKLKTQRSKFKNEITNKDRKLMYYYKILSFISYDELKKNVFSLL